jgi:hypothetical protein
MISRRVDRWNGTRSVENNVRKILIGTNLLSVLLSLFLFLVDGFGPFSIALMAVSTVLFYVNFKSLSETILLLLVYPFSWFFLTVPLRNKSLEDFVKVELPLEIRLDVGEDVLSALPVKAILVVGDVGEKKRIVATIVKNIVRGIQVEQNMKYLKILQKDPHMDVTLRATMALEEIENHFDQTIARCANPKDFCAHLYFYLKTDIPKGALRKDIERILRQLLERVSEHEPVRYEVLHYVTKDEEHLWLGYKKTHNKELLARYLFEKLRKRDYETLTQHLNEVKEIFLREGRDITR